MAGGDLGEAGLPREFGQTAFVLGVFPRVHQHDGAGARCRRRARAAKACARRCFVERFDFLAVDADAAADLHDPLVQHRRQRDREVEQPRPRLVADAQRVGEAAVDHQQRALALALEQRVGRDGGAHLHRLDQPGGIGASSGDAEHGLDAGDRGVAVAAGVLAAAACGSTGCPSGSRATMSVKVPPRSIQNCHLPDVIRSASLSVTRSKRALCCTVTRVTAIQLLE